MRSQLTRRISSSRKLDHPKYPPVHESSLVTFAHHHSNAIRLNESAAIWKRIKWIRIQGIMCQQECWTNPAVQRALRDRETVFQWCYNGETAQKYSEEC
jgi:hypothetical protein